MTKLEERSDEELMEGIRGGDQIQVGDNVIVVTLEHGLHDLRDIVEE